MTVLSELISEADAALADYEYVAAVYRSAENPSPEYEAAYTEFRDRAKAASDRVAEVNEDEERSAKVAAARSRLAKATPSPVVVREEQRTYGPGSQHSYFADLCWRALPGDANYEGAMERQTKHGIEMVRDAVNDSQLRSRLIKSAKEYYRKDSVRARQFTEDIQRRALEVRALDTGGTSGGSFVTPQYLVQDYAPFRQFGRAFINATNLLPLPDYGMTVYLPAVNAAAGVTAQSSQNTTVSESDPTSGYLMGNLTTEAGQVTISQQLLDRAGPGIEFDRIVFDQLTRAYNAAVDTSVINAATTSAGTITDTSTSTATGPIVIQDFYADVAAAQAQMETASGTVYSPTHLFATPTEWGYLSSQVDSQSRPLIVPGYAGPFNAIAAALSGNVQPAPEGDTGYEVLSIPVYKDGNLPTNASSQQQLIVAHMPEVFVWEGELIPRTIPQTFAQNLSVLLQVYSYNTTIVRYPKAVQVISGARYAGSPTFIRA